MAPDSGMCHMKLDERTTLSHLRLHGYYIQRNRDSEDKYLSHAGVWESTCINGWFSSIEGALATFEKIKPKILISTMALSDELHWETRNA